MDGQTERERMPFKTETRQRKRDLHWARVRRASIAPAMYRRERVASVGWERWSGVGREGDLENDGKVSERKRRYVYAGRGTTRIIRGAI